MSDFLYVILLIVVVGFLTVLAYAFVAYVAIEVLAEHDLSLGEALGIGLLMTAVSSSVSVRS